LHLTNNEEKEKKKNKLAALQLFSVLSGKVYPCAFYVVTLVWVCTLMLCIHGKKRKEREKKKSQKVKIHIIYEVWCITPLTVLVKYKKKKKENKKKNSPIQIEYLPWFGLYKQYR